MSSEVAEVTGKYFKDSREIQPRPDVLDDNAVQRLWQIGEH